MATTLADELLNDFESGSEAQEEEDQQSDKLHRDGASPERDGDEEDEAEDNEASEAMRDADDEEETKARVEKMNLSRVKEVGKIAGLMRELRPLLEQIAHYQTLPTNQQTDVDGSLEEHPEYQLLTKSNEASTKIDSEVILVHKFIRDHYSARFPELETLVTNPLDYAKTVAVIGNGPMEDIRKISTSSDNLVGQPLRGVLDGPSLMVVTVEATTTKGRELSEVELEKVIEACKMVIQLDKAKKTLTDYVQSRMTVFAPNLTILIGSLTAAQLLNFAGGLRGLAKTPACNIAPLGSKKQTQTGFATNVGIRHQGFLYNSPIIKGIPSDMKKQAMRIVSAKVVLAARIDSVHTSPDGSTGRELRQACLDRLDKLTESAPNKGVRALPAPDDKPAGKRGGRRARKAKEATAMTDLRKAQNRMAFGKEEQEVGYGTGEGTKGLGMIGQANDGRIRALQVDQRTRAKLSKKMPGWGLATPVGGMSSSLRGFGQGAGNATVLRAQGLRTSGIGSTAGTAGTASTIAFTPVQGLELVDPKVRDELNRKRKAEEDRWFKGGTFTQLPVTSAVGSSGTGESGFKVPRLPASKRQDTAGLAKG